MSQNELAPTYVTSFMIISKQSEEIKIIGQLKVSLKLFSLSYHIEKDFDKLNCHFRNGEDPF